MRLDRINEIIRGVGMVRNLQVASSAAGLNLMIARGTPEDFEPSGSQSSGTSSGLCEDVKSSGPRSGGTLSGDFEDISSRPSRCRSYRRVCCCVKRSRNQKQR